uniref:Uncharacterized protein n=1 Tax=Strongyloides stercoralis TaxID=6248 RepID=A0A0K0EB72_STRER
MKYYNIIIKRLKNQNDKEKKKYKKNIAENVKKLLIATYILLNFIHIKPLVVENEFIKEREKPFNTRQKLTLTTNNLTEDFMM